MATSDSTGGAIAGAAITSMGNYVTQAASNRRQFKYAQKSMELQQKYNKELWDYQNAYNTPQAQMDRLQAAGLNPRLIYGSGGANTGNAGPIAPSDVPIRQASNLEMPDPFNKHLIARQADAQYAATMQNIANNKQKQELDSTRTALENLKLMREGMRSKNYKDLAQAELDTQKFIALRSGELFSNAKSQGNLMDQLHAFREKQNPQSLESTKLENAFKTNRNELAKFGIYQTDHPAFRILMQAANRQGIDLSELLKNGIDKLKYLFE